MKIKEEDGAFVILMAMIFIFVLTVIVCGTLMNIFGK